MSGWTEQGKPERDRSLFWHWIWRESGKPRSRVVYDIMRRVKHNYHYNNNLYLHKQLHVHGTYKALITKLQLH